MQYFEYATTSESQDIDGFIVTLQQLFHNNKSTLEITIESDSHAEEYKITYEQFHNANVEFILNLHTFDLFLEELSTSDILTDNYFIRFTGLIERDFVNIIKQCFTEIADKKIRKPLVSCYEDLFVTPPDADEANESAEKRMIPYDLTRYSVIHVSQIAFEQYLRNNCKQFYLLDILDDVSLIMKQRRRMVITEYSEYDSQEDLIDAIQRLVPDILVGPKREILKNDIGDMKAHCANEKRTRARKNDSKKPSESSVTT